MSGYLGYGRHGFDSGGDGGEDRGGGQCAAGRRCERDSVAGTLSDVAVPSVLDGAEADAAVQSS